MRVWLLVLSLVVLGASCTNRGGGGPADISRGDKYFKTKCNACHPNGGQGAGPALASKPIPGPLKKGGSGRHGVPDGEWDSLLLYITPIMNPAAAVAVAPVAAPPAATPPVAAPPTAAPPAAPPADGTMKTCNCTCQCPAGTPPGQMSQCTCQCVCPQ